MSSLDRVGAVLHNAGGQIVGRTRFQKTVYILSCALEWDDFSFEYKHYGPYSEDLENAIELNVLFDDIIEEKKNADWGGLYYIYKIPSELSADANFEEFNDVGVALASQCAKANAVELELAATSLFLARDGVNDPWGETARRKPEKIGNGRLDKAKLLYQQLSEVAGEGIFPAI